MSQNNTLGKTVRILTFAVIAAILILLGNINSGEH